MGLDLYAGPLCRYLSGDWETCAANVARDTGLKYVLYRASGAPDLLSREDAFNLATSYQHQLTEELDDRTSRAVEWKEGFSAPYWTKGLSHSGRMALILWAAYLRYPQPVSYTHLDVYKRQGLDGAACQIGSSTTARARIIP